MFSVLMFPRILQANRGAANLRKQGCPDYPSLQQLFAFSTATGNLQISSNTPPLNSDEEHVGTSIIGGAVGCERIGSSVARTDEASDPLAFDPKRYGLVLNSKDVDFPPR